MVTAISATTVAIAWDAASRKRVHKGSCEKHSSLATAFFYIQILTAANYRI
jgi:hypothetical protein